MPRSEAQPLHVYRPFVIAALACTLTFGATFGAYNLLFIHLALGPVHPAHNQAHATFQVLGFVLLFVMGVAYHVAPRFIGARLARPDLARATLWLALGGVLLRATGQLYPLLPARAALLALGLGAALLFAAVVVFAGLLLATFRARRASEPYQGFLAAGTAWWVAAAAFGAWGAGRALLDGDPDAAVPWNEPLYAAALFGGALSWIHGVLLRTAPAFLGSPPASQALAHAALWLGQAGALLTTLGMVAPGTRVGAVTQDLGLAVLATSIVLFHAGARLWEREPRVFVDAGFQRAMRAALTGALLFAALGASYAALDLAGRAPGKLLFDGARHAFTLGFVTLVILAMATKLVPAFANVPLRWPALRLVGTALVAGGVVLRELQVAIVVWPEPRLLHLSGASGVLAASGVALFSASLLGSLSAARKLREPLARRAQVEPILTESARRASVK